MASTSALDERLSAFFAASAVPGVVSAYLFGSHAEGRAHRESDIDVAVLLDRDRYPTERDRFEARVHLIGSVGSAVGSNRLDLVILNEAPPSSGTLNRHARPPCVLHERRGRSRVRPHGPASRR